MLNVFRKVFILVLLQNILYGYSVYTINDEEYEMYKKDPAKTIDILKNKYFYKIEEKKPEVVKNVVDYDKNITISKDNITNKLETTEEKIQKSNKSISKLEKNEKVIIKKAQINKQKDILSLDVVKQSLKYSKIISNKELDTLINSINFYYKDKEVEIDPDEVKTVLENIKDKKYPIFEANLYLEQLKDFLKD